MSSYEQEVDEFSRSPSGSSNAGDEPEKDESAMIKEALNFARLRYAPSPPTFTSRLWRPVAIPQVSPKMNSPFVRAYSEVLSAQNIRIEEFVQFVDNFNILMTGSPPLVALNSVGQVLGFVPNHWAQLAGGITQVAAGIATYAVIKTRCAQFLKLSNTEFFEPRGLKVQVKSTEEVAKISGVALQDVMVQPLRPDDDMAAIDPLSRRLKAVEGYMAPLLFDVPPPAEQTNVLARLSQKQSEATRKKIEQKALKDRRRVLEKLDGGQGKDRKDIRKERRRAREAEKIDEKAAKIEAKAEKEMQKAMKEKPSKRDEKIDKIEKEREKELAKAQHEYEKLRAKANKESKKDHKGNPKDKEISASKKGLWIIVRNVDEARADEAEEERRKADAPIGLLSLSR
jgi:flagellar biosynthesis GTPase FlhF